MSSSPAFPDQAPLLALVNATAEWHAGLPGTCSASIRLLDRVHFTVYRGDCVVVHHDDPASARVLLDALGGQKVANRRLRGARYCAAGVRIRRCSIPVHAVGALQAGWQQLDHAWDSSIVATPAVHLLRASRQAVVTASSLEQWAAWAYRVRSGGGALVIVASAQPRHAIREVHRAPVEVGVGASLREVPAARYTSQRVEQVPHATHSYAFRLHHGRLLNLRTWE